MKDDLHERVEKIRLIALDLDGTVLNQDRVITPQTGKVIKELLARGYVVVPSTGRALHDLFELFPELSDVRYVISTNGALVTDRACGKYIYKSSIRRETAATLVSRLLDEKDNGVYLNTASRRLLAVRDASSKVFSEGIEKPNTAGELCEWLITHDEDVLEIGLRFGTAGMFERYEELVASHYPQISSFRVGPVNLEFVSADVSTGSALEKLGEYLHIPSDQLCAVGDNGNDVGMLTQAGFSVAMGNAIDSVKALADFVTDDNAHDGAVAFLERFFLK